jgi:molybdopterin molybdotransferase
MITFEEAIKIIQVTARPLTAEQVHLSRSLNRVLANDVVSDTDMPPFNKAAMDGFACREADIEGKLRIVEEIPAGKVPVHSIEAGECSRIMTGAMVPAGADFVVMKEHVVITGNQIQVVKKGQSANICVRGEDLLAGEIILKSGTRLQPAHLAVLSASGCVLPTVYKLPGVAVISTGNELVEPDNKPEAGKIRNSNGYQLMAQCVQYGLTPEYLGIIPDDPEILINFLFKAMQRFELILISGGVSVGDYDYIPRTLEKLRLDTMFHGLLVKPGKHMLLASYESGFVAGMPGNPVSSFVMFEVLIKPLLDKLTGIQSEARGFSMPIETAYNRKKSDTLFFIPVSITDKGTAHILEYHGSAHIHAYTHADGIMEVPAGISEIKEGDRVYVRPL